MSDGSSLGDKRPVLEVGTLQDCVWANKNVVSNDDISRNVCPVLNNTVIADTNGCCAKNSRTIPDRTVLSDSDISENGCIGCDKDGVFDLRLHFGISQFPQARH